MNSNPTGSPARVILLFLFLLAFSAAGLAATTIHVQDDQTTFYQSDVVVVWATGVPAASGGTANLLWEWDYDGDGQVDQTREGSVDASDDEAVRAITTASFSYNQPKHRIDQAHDYTPRLTVSGEVCLTILGIPIFCDAVTESVTGPTITVLPKPQAVIKLQDEQGVAVDPSSVQQNQLITLDATSSVGGNLSYEWFVDGARVGELARAKHRFAEARDYDLVLNITDPLGGTSTVGETLTVTQEGGPPPGELDFVLQLEPPGPYNPGDAFEIRTIGDVLNIVVYIYAPDNSLLVDAEVVPNSYWNWTVPQGAAAGRYKLDVIGNGEADITGAESLFFQVGEDVPLPTDTQVPVADFSFSVTGAREVTFTNRSTDADGDPLTYTWDFGDGTQGSTEENPVHMFADYGTFSVSLVANDGQADSQTFRKSVTIEVSTTGDNPPVAKFISITRGGSLKVSFDAHNSKDVDYGPDLPGYDPDVPNGIFEYEWDFGDGQSESSNEPTLPHTYFSPGIYPVTLTVYTLDNDSASLTKDVDVSLACTPSPIIPQDIQEEEAEGEQVVCPTQVGVCMQDSPDSQCFFPFAFREGKTMHQSIFALDSSNNDVDPDGTRFQYAMYWGVPTNDNATPEELTEWKDALFGKYNIYRLRPWDQYAKIETKNCPPGSGVCFVNEEIHGVAFISHPACGVLSSDIHLSPDFTSAEAPAAEEVSPYKDPPEVTIDCGPRECLLDERGNCTEDIEVTCTANYLPAPEVGCFEGDTTYDNQLIPEPTFDWSYGGCFIDGGEEASFLFENGGIYNIYVTATDHCGRTASDALDVDINWRPKAEFVAEPFDEHVSLHERLVSELESTGEGLAPKVNGVLATPIYEEDEDGNSLRGETYPRTTAFEVRADVTDPDIPVDKAIFEGLCNETERIVNEDEVEELIEKYKEQFLNQCGGRNTGMCNSACLSHDYRAETCEQDRCKDNPFYWRNHLDEISWVKCEWKMPDGRRHDTIQIPGPVEVRDPADAILLIQCVDNNGMTARGGGRVDDNIAVLSGVTPFDVWFRSTDDGNRSDHNELRTAFDFNHEGPYSTDPDGPLVKFDWDFENGTQTYSLLGARAFDYNFLEEGKYTAKFQIRCLGGWCTVDQRDIYVSHPLLRILTLPEPAAGLKPLDVTFSIAPFPEEEAPILPPGIEPPPPPVPGEEPEPPPTEPPNPEDVLLSMEAFFTQPNQWLVEATIIGTTPETYRWTRKEENKATITSVTQADTLDDPNSDTRQYNIDNPATITVTVTDTFGQQYTDFIDITPGETPSGDTNPPRILLFEVEASDLPLEGMVSFDAESTGPCIVGYSVVAKKGGAEEVLMEETFNCQQRVFATGHQVTFTSGGDYAVTFTVFDEQGGQASQTTNVTIRETPAPGPEPSAEEVTITAEKSTLGPDMWLIKAAQDVLPSEGTHLYTFEVEGGPTYGPFTVQGYYNSKGIIKPFEPGTYTIKVTVTTEDGGQPVTGSETFDLLPPADNLPPVLDFTLAPDPLTDMAVWAEIDASDPEGCLSGFTVNAGDGRPTKPERPGFACKPFFDLGKQSVGLYNTPGTYTVTITVWDDVGHTVSKSLEVTVPFTGEPVSTGGTGGTGTGGDTSTGTGGDTSTGTGGDTSTGTGTGDTSTGTGGTGANQPPSLSVTLRPSDTSDREVWADISASDPEGCIKGFETFDGLTSADRSTIACTPTLTRSVSVRNYAGNLNYTGDVTVRVLVWDDEQQETTARFDITIPFTETLTFNSASGTGTTAPPLEWPSPLHILNRLQARHPLVLYLQEPDPPAPEPYPFPVTWEFGDRSRDRTQADVIGPVTHLYEREGLFYAQATSTADVTMGGETTQETRSSFKDVNVHPPLQIVTDPPNQRALTAGATVVFWGAIKGEDLRLVWDFGDGTEPVETLNVVADGGSDTNTGGEMFQSEPVDHVFHLSGVYDVIATVYDGAGKKLGEDTLRYFVSDPGVFIRHKPDKLLGFSPFEVTFFPETPWGDTVSYEWDFERYGIFEESEPTVTFIAGWKDARLYTVRLDVIDDETGALRGSAFKEVHVLPQFQIYLDPEPPHLLNQDVEHLEAYSSRRYHDRSTRWILSGGGLRSGREDMVVSQHQRFSSAGDFNVVLEVTDTRKATGSFRHLVHVNAAPIARFDSYDLNDRLLSKRLISGTTPLTIRFDANESEDPDGEIVLYEWDFGDEAGMQEGIFVEHTFVEGGDYTVTLTVTDNENGTGTATVEVHVNQPPIAVINAIPTTGPPPLEVEFDASASTDDGEIRRYRWDFGDGGRGSGKIVKHTYRDFGIYTATLTLTDDEGLVGTDSLDISVVETIAEYPISIVAVPPSGEAPLTVSFSVDDKRGGLGGSAGNHVYVWDFGDGTGGLEAVAPVHTYEAPGVYHVRVLVIFRALGVEHVVAEPTATIFVQSPALSGELGAVPKAGNAPLWTVFFRPGRNREALWDFGDNTRPQRAINVSHLFERGGAFKVIAGGVESTQAGVSQRVFVAEQGPSPPTLQGESTLTLSAKNFDDTVALGEILQFVFRTPPGEINLHESAVFVQAGATYWVPLAPLEVDGSEEDAAQLATYWNTKDVAPHSSVQWSAVVTTQSGATFSYTGAPFNLREKWCEELHATPATPRFDIVFVASGFEDYGFSRFDALVRTAVLGEEGLLNVSPFDQFTDEFRVFALKSPAYYGCGLSVGNCSYERLRQEASICGARNPQFILVDRGDWGDAEQGVFAVPGMAVVKGPAAIQNPALALHGLAHALGVGDTGNPTVSPYVLATSQNGQVYDQLLLLSQGVEPELPNDVYADTVNAQGGRKRQHAVRTENVAEEVLGEALSEALARQHRYIQSSRSALTQRLLGNLPSFNPSISEVSEIDVAQGRVPLDRLDPATLGQTLGPRLPSGTG